MDIDKGFALVLDSKRHRAYFKFSTEPWRPVFPNEKSIDVAWACACIFQDELRLLDLENNDLSAPELMAKIAERMKNEI